MKLAFVCEQAQEPGWDDGLHAAIMTLESRGHALVTPKQADIILYWGSFMDPKPKELRKLGKPMAICFAGGDTNGPTIDCFDHIFVESAIYFATLKADGKSVSIAFGTNTALFSPLNQQKIFDTIYPATFAKWKRHRLYGEATEGLASLACGLQYPDHEQECWQTCIDHKVTILPHVSANVLHYLYAASKICVITADSSGGSQRTVLEAMAMNIPVIVTDSNKFDFAGERIYYCDPNPQELRGYIDTLLNGDGDTNTRDYVVENYSHITYADKLEKELANLILV